MNILPFSVVGRYLRVLSTGRKGRQKVHPKTLLLPPPPPPKKKFCKLCFNRGQIFHLGGKILKVVEGGVYWHRLLFSRPPSLFGEKFESSDSGSQTVSM